MAGFEARLHLAYDEWPPADRLRWERTFAEDDPFGDAAGARLAKSSRHQYLMGWRRFLGFLAIEEPAALELSPEQRLNPSRVRSFARHLAETNTPQSVAIQVDALYKAARIMLADIDLAWLKNIKARLHTAAPAAGAAGRVITSLQIRELGLKLMEAIQAEPGAPIRLADAVTYRDGLMFALLAYQPMRRKNTAAIEIGRELIREGDDWYVVFPPADTKTRVPIEFGIPERLRPYLEAYLDVFRPRLLRGRTSSALWISAKGYKLSYAIIGDVFARQSERHVGHRITPP
jgi:hypothetical protein